MGHYLYHLKLELYQAVPDAIKSKEDTRTLEDPIYIPPHDANIFTSPLPSHDITTWQVIETAAKRRRRPPIQTSASQSSVSTSTRGPLDDSKSQALLVSEGDIHRRPVPNKPASTTNPKGTLSSVFDDYRFGRVSIQSVDMALPEEVEDGRSRGLSVGQTVRPKAPGGMAMTGTFVPSDPKNTEVGWGVVRLYRDAQTTLDPDAEDTSAPSKDSSRPGAFAGDGSNEDGCTTLCILAVPSYMTPSDLLGFVGEQTREDVTHFRMIRSSKSNKYMVLMKFREAQRARAWQKEWNGKNFNIMEPENCHVVFISSVEFSPQDAQRGPSSFPNMLNDPFTPSQHPNHPAPLAPGAAATKALPQPASALVELPTCPVCLERMDESTGLLTILCQHVFHCDCLEKWKGSGCPVCRYTQNELTTDDLDNECSVCSSTTNLWICLICGNTGCGRYDSAHAFAHYEATGHSYAMDIMTQHVWDYIGDGYVHRLISTKGDGKSGDALGANMTAYSNEDVPREKLDNMGMEYAFMISSQLESQRLYYEDQLDRAVDKASSATTMAEDANRSMRELAEQVEVLQTSFGTAQASIVNFEKEVQRVQKRAEKAETLARRMTKDWQEEKAVGEGLAKRIAHMQTKMEEAEQKLAALEAEKRDLEEQNRDLSFFISGQAKLKELGEEDVAEAQEGRVEVPMPEQSKRRKGKNKK